MNKTKLMFVLLSSLFLGACSSDDDSNGGGNGGNGDGTTYTETKVSEAPVWQIDWTNNQERPNWTEPDGSLYENWTTLMVQIEETLQPYASQNDLLALFVNDELRGLASPAVGVDSEQSGNTQFLMKVWGNETGTEKVNVSLRYYSQNLKHIFTLSDDIVLNSDETTGIEEDFIPEFTLGSAKYPVVKTVSVENILSRAGLTAGEGNLIGAFVGEECRGTVSLSASGGTSLVIYGRSAGESVTVKYYDAAKGVLYTIPGAVKL